jgi:ectoine hydroxylase-related dioxygenase (phytanoyl-CoA dioxygenase family)
MNISNNIKQLNEEGYTIIHNVYNKEEISEYWYEFNSWQNSIPEIIFMHNTIDFNGIYKHHQVGHQRFAWLARTNPKILNIFKQLWNTEDLVCSFDGCCHYSSEYVGKPHYWIHTDQSSRKKGVHCYQSFLSLTNNSERTLLLYKGSHLLHEDYFTTMEIDEPKDWNILDQNYVNELAEDKIYLNVKEGDLVIWDSRTFHQNTCGNSSCNEERLVQYLCYLPKDNEKNDAKQKNLRRKYFEKLRTTSHWPYPMNVVPEQPNMYNYYNPNFQITIDYDSLIKPKLDDLKEEIEKLL